MLRTRSLVNALLSGLHYRGLGDAVVNGHVPYRFLSVAAAGSPAPGIDAANTTVDSETAKDDEEPASPPRSRRRDAGEVRFGTLQYLLNHRMPISSMRLLTNGVRMACDERQGETMVQYLGPWIAQLCRPEVLERLMPWSICIVLRDLMRLSKLVGIDAVRNALPPKHLQTLANRLVVQGFDKITPIQLAFAAEAFGRLRPWQKRPTLDQEAIDAGVSPAATLPVWPSFDWVDELVDWLHNLKPDVEPWPRTSSFTLGAILYGLARSNYKPRQPTLEASAVAMKAKFEEQLKSGYLSRQALVESSRAWNMWRINPEDHAPGYWDVYLKSAGQAMEEYVDSVPDPPSFEDGVVDTNVDESSADGPEKKRPLQRFGSQSLLWKRREFRDLLVTVALAVDNFNLTKQFNESIKPIWEQRVDEHAPFLAGTSARRILGVSDHADITLKEKTRETLTKAASHYGNRARPPASASRADRDINEFDDFRGDGVGISSKGTGGRGATRATDEFDDFDDFRSGTQQKSGGAAGGRSTRRGDIDFDGKQF